jgi:hypothetical protein
MISYGGRAAIGFSLGAPVVSGLGLTDEAVYVINVINRGLGCPPTSSGVAPAIACFQRWYNTTYASSGVSKTLRTDGVFDQDTLDALKMVAKLRNVPDAPTCAEGQTLDLITGTCVTAAASPTSPTPAAPASSSTAGLSTGAIVGIALGGATALGLLIYAVTK